MVTLLKINKIKEVDISIDRNFIENELENRDNEFALKWGLSFSDSYKKTMKFISDYNN